MEYNKSIDTTDFVYNTKTNGDPGRSGVTADFIKTISKNNTVSESSPVTVDWLKKNRKSINDFVVNVDRNTISDFRKSLTDAESWQTQDKMDDTIRKTEVLYKSGLLDIGEKEYNEIINGLKNNKEIFGQFSEETYNMLKDMGGYLTYNEVQDSILRIKQSMSLSDDENHKRMLRKRLNFLENYQENVGFTDSGYYDEQIRQIKAKKQNLLDEQNVLALLKHTSPEYYKRHGEITDELGEVDSKLEELEAQRYTAKIQESVEENKKYFSRVETFFGLGEDDPVEKRLQAAYELKEMDKYMSRPDFQTVLADIGKVKEANAAGFYNDNAKGSDGFWDLNYLYVNRYMPEELQTSYKALQNFDEETLDMLFDSAHDAFSRLATSNMLQAERDVYNYIHATEGQEAATAFLDKYVKPRITGEIADEVREEAETLAKESPVAAWTLSVGNKALLEPIEGMTNLAHMAIDPEGYNENWVAHEQTFIQTNTIRQTQSEALGNIGGMIYNVGTGVVDLGLELATSKITSTYLGALGAVDKIGSLKSTANKATKGGQFYYTDKAAYDRITGWVKQTISSSKIAGYTLSDARARGLSGTQAIGEALSMAAIEWATEHIGIDNLLKADASVIRTMISEGMEEGLSAIADPIVDAWIAGDKSKWKISVRNYINEGKNYNDAVSLAFRDVVGDVVYEAGLGALTGGVFKGSMKLVGNLFGNSQIPKSAVWIRTDTEKTKANASASIRKWGSITMKRNDVGDIYIDSKKQLSAVEASLTGQEAAAVASIRKVVRNGKVVNEHTEQGKALYRIAGAAEGDVVLYTPMRMVGDDRGALHSVAVRLSQAGAIGKYEVSGVILDGDVLLNLELSVKSPLVMENESLYTGNTETDGTRYSLNGAVDNVDYDALEKYDSRTYANSGWVTVNRVLTGKELKKINSQFADAVANGFQYPKTSSGEIIITVGDADGDANKLVYISGTLENPIISKIVQINPSDTSDISAIRQNIIDMEVEGYVNIWDIVASVFGEEVCRIQSSEDFRSYRELKGARQDRQSNDFINRDHQQRNTGGRSGAENPAGDRGTVTDTGITEDSLASNDGPGTELYTQNEENPQQTAAQHMGSNGVRMQSVPTHDIKQENGASQNFQSNAVRDRRAEIGVNPSEMDTIFNSMGEWQQQKVLTTLEKNTGTHILLDETLEADGEYDSATKTIRINPNRATPVTVIKHELTHFIENSGMLYQDFMNYAMKSRAFSEWLESKGYTIETIGDMRKELADRYAKHGEQLDVRPGASADQEILANFVAEKLFMDLDSLLELKARKPKLFNRFRAWLSRMIRGYEGTPVEKELRHMEKMFKQAVEYVQGQESVGETKHSFAGYEEDGKGKYRSNFPKGTPKLAKSKKILQYIQNVWSKKPIRLKINENGIERYIYAQFDPTYVEPRFGYTDASKLMGGNRHGTASEQRVTLDLADDYYQIASEATYNYSKDETGKDTQTHQDVIRWHYFINDIYFAEYGSEIYKPYRVTINVKEKTNGHYVYSFSAEKIEQAAPQTLHAAVKGGEPPTVNDLLYDTTVSQNNTGVNTKYMQKSENNSQKKFIAPDTTTETPGDQLTDAELLEQLRKRGLSAAQNPLQIAQLKPDDADTTPALRGIGNVNTKGDGESAFADSVQQASIFSDELKQLAAEDTNITRYDAITNKETMVAANKRINEGGKSFVEKLQKKGAAFYTSDDIATSIILISRYEKIGDHQSALFMLEKIREAGTIAGQTVQTLSLLSRLTPEGMLAYAQKELSQAYKAMVEGQTSKWIRDNADRFQLTDEDAEFILKRTWQAAQLPKGRDKNIRLAEIAERIRSKIPQEKGQAFKAWQRTAMLLNPKTQLRNIIGNATMAPAFVASDTVGSGIDALLSKATGVRTTARFQWSSVKGMAKGFFESYDDFLRHISTRDINADRFDIKAQSSKNFNEHHKGFAAGARNNISKAMNALDRFNSFLLEAGDRSFYEMWFINSLNGQMKTNKVTEPTAEMIEIATQDALQRTWQDDNSMTRSVSRLKHGLNDLFSIHGYGLGDVFIKFTKTPANLTKAMIDFSPVGLLKAISADAIRFTAAVKEGRVTPQMQRKFVKNLSNGITGTLMTALFAALASAGLVTGEQDEDKDVSAFERAVFGKQPYSFKIGNESFSYDWAQPAAAHLAAMANFLQDKRNAELTGEEKIWYQSVLDAFKTGGKVLYNQSFMQSLQNLFADDDFITNALNGILSDASASVPQTLSQAASSLDPTVRTTYETGDDVQTAINKVLYKIPGARETLAPSVDVLGNERKQIENPVGRTLSSFLSPANISSGYDSVAGDEMYRLYQATGEASAIAPVAPNYVNSKKGKYTLTSKEKAEYQKITGQMSSKAVESLVNSKFYQELADEMKVKLLSSIYSYSKQVANNKVLGLPISESYEKAHKAISAGVPVEMYYLLKNTASSDGNDSVSQKEAKAALDASGLSREQKRIMWQSFNDSWKYNPYGSSGYKYY